MFVLVQDGTEIRVSKRSLLLLNQVLSLEDEVRFLLFLNDSRISANFSSKCFFVDALRNIVK